MGAYRGFSLTQKLTRKDALMNKRLWAAMGGFFYKGLYKQVLVIQDAKAHSKSAR